MAKKSKAKEIKLTASLEDYLETILQLTRAKPVARIKDIARARDVKAGSVSAAMKRLESLGLIRYERNEYIELTVEGARRAQKVLSRHLVLTSFFEDILDMPADEAGAEACAMEHHLSDAAMDKFVRFFEFLRTCPGAPSNFLELFHGCRRLDGEAECGFHCSDPACVDDEWHRNRTSINELEHGQEGTIMHVGTAPAIRQRLLDMGILPGVKVKMERRAPGGDPVWIRIEGYQLSLRREEAEGVAVEL